MRQSVTSAYNKEWQKKIDETGRLAWQGRALFAFSNFFRNILHIPLAGQLLDIGCGDGSLVEAFNREIQVHARGIDISDGINFEADPLPCKDDEFDIVLMYSVIEHLYDPGNILSEVRRVLKPRGILLIITPHFDLSNILLCDRAFYNDPTHVHPYDTVSIRHLMRLYQFKERFIGLWTVRKSSLLWRLPTRMQFYIGTFLPFAGTARCAPSFLRGKSRTMLCVFQNAK